MKKILTQKIKQTFQFDSTSAICKYLAVETSLFEEAVNHAEICYSPMLLLKKNKVDYRTIHAPTEKLKMVQRVVLDSFISKTPLPTFVYGYGQNKTIIDNAKAHQGNKFLLNVDIKDFFPSVHYKKVQKIFRELGFTADQSLMLTRLTTLKKCLPQGAPTSPYLSALAINSLDNRIWALCKKNRLTYTRYFDDISISGSKRAHEIFEKLSAIAVSEGYKLHTAGDKVQFYRPGDVKSITGILILEDGSLSVEGKEELSDYIITLAQTGVSFLEAENLLKEKQVLYGKVDFISQVDPPLGANMKILLDSVEWLI